jgi:hypothetical protein
MFDDLAADRLPPGIWTVPTVTTRPQASSALVTASLGRPELLLPAHLRR